MLSLRGMESQNYERSIGSGLQDRFAQVRQTSCLLAQPLSPEDQSVQSMDDASPTKWHLAHTSWFFETFILRPRLAGYPVFDPAYESLFNSYYNSVGSPFPRPRRGMISRPGVEEVMTYRAHVDRHMARLLADLESAARPEDQAPVFELTELGLQHEQQHQELLLTDIKHALFQNPLYPSYKQERAGPRSGIDATTVEVRGGRRATANGETSDSALPELRFAGYAGGIVEIGHRPLDGFCYDNETPRHRVLLQDFELAQRPLCNAEVIAFIEAGGYENPLLWLSDGWAFRTQHELRHPLYFVPDGEGGYQEFTLGGLEPLHPAGTTCHLTYFEADAMARFFGARLPTEQEWERASCGQELTGQFLDVDQLHPLGVPNGHHEKDLWGLFGGVWEWTQSSYAPYPGYQPPAGAVGEYNGKFMHNQMVLRGGSCVTPNGHLRRTYRNFFPSHAQWQFTGVRLAR